MFGKFPNAGFGFTSAIFNLMPVPDHATGEAVSVFINDTDSLNRRLSIRWAAVFLCQKSAVAICHHLRDLLD